MALDDIVDRRTAMRRIATLFGAAAVLDPIDLLARHRQVRAHAPLNEKGYLYDLQLESYPSQKAAVEAKRSLERHVGPLYIAEAHGKYTVMLSANAIGDAATLMAVQLKQKGIDSFKVLHPFFYNRHATEERFAMVPVGKDGIAGVVKNYTTAYGSDELMKTVRSLQVYYAKRGLPAFPRAGSIVPVPMRFLKAPYRVGMTEGTDFKIVKFGPDDSIWDVVSEYTNDDLENNVRSVMGFNQIRHGQERLLQPGDRIMIPIGQYHDPLQGVAVKIEGDDTARIVKELPPDPDRAEKRAALETQVPGTNVDGLIQRRQKGIAVLRDTHMPSVLIENFNINNPAQVAFWDNQANIDAVTDAYARGIASYARKNEPALRYVFVDDGHGKYDPGTHTVFRGRTLTETYFVERIHDALVRAIGRHGLAAVPLKYTGRASAVERTRWFTSHANSRGNTHNSIYVSLHVDYGRDPRWAPLPRGFIHNRGTQENSKALAHEILAQAVPTYRARGG